MIPACLRNWSTASGFSGDLRWGKYLDLCIALSEGRPQELMRYSTAKLEAGDAEEASWDAVERRRQMEVLKMARRGEREERRYEFCLRKGSIATCCSVWGF